MCHSIGMLCPSGVLFRAADPPHWVHSAVSLPDLELESDLAASAAIANSQAKLKLAIVRAVIDRFLMLVPEEDLPPRTRRTQRERIWNCFVLCVLRVFVTLKFLTELVRCHLQIIQIDLRVARVAVDARRALAIRRMVDDFER